MSAHAAFSATYSDLRFVKSRKVAQVTLEIPIEQADAFVKAFGTPNPATETWVGIARLDPEKTTEPAKGKLERRHFGDLPLAQQAAMRCQEPAFRTFLARGNTQIKMFDIDMAAAKVRECCGVESRSELDKSQSAAARWKALDDAYWAWSRGIE